MGNKPLPPPPEKPKTVKGIIILSIFLLLELVKEFSKSINRLKREFNREVMRMEMQTKKMQKDLEKSVKNKEPKTTQRMLAQNILRNQQYIQKYQRLDAQLSDIQFQLNQAATTETLVQVMQGMTGIMKQANSTIDVKNVQQSIEVFGMEVEKQNFLQEQLGEIMNQEEDDISDENADKLIMEMEQKVGGSGGNKELVGQPMQQQQPQQNDVDDLDARLKNL